MKRTGKIAEGKKSRKGVGEEMKKEKEGEGDVQDRYSGYTLDILTLGCILCQQSQKSVQIQEPC